MNEREIEKFVFRLILENRDLSGLEDGIKELILSCQRADELDVVKHVLEEMLIISSGHIDHPIRQMAKTIVRIASNEAPKNFAVVAMAWGPEADSSQGVVQILKPQLRDAKNLKIFNSVPEYLKGDRQLEYPNAILVDDFTGTGSTVKNRVDHILSAAANRGIDATCQALILFGMATAREYLEISNTDVDIFHEMKAGLSGYFEGQDLHTKIAAMKRMEARLAAVIDNKPLPSMGYGRAEAMFCVKERNAPNSNFPILWWPENAAGERVNTIMDRYEL